MNGDKNSLDIERLIEKILSDDEFLSYEIIPQKAFSLDSTLEKIKQSELYNLFDAFICTDSPLARLKHSSILASIKAQNYLKKPTICTISVRDKNSIAIQGEILGLNEFDIRIFLALKGDPIRLGDQPQAKGVFESNSYMLFDIINALNDGKDLANLNIKDNGRKIYPFAVVNSFANDMENIYKRMFRKVQKGAIALVTQPIYDINNAKELLLILERVNKELGKNAKLILGYHPVSSLKAAEFLYNKLPGCYIPSKWIDKLRNASDERSLGLELSRNLYKELRAVYPKIHFMCANSIKMAESIILE
ncbi:hypothetical protein CCY99_05890 [Helicobacter sp. 16-1353]|uniref:methylenetetrahydrofolate reductase n=1 Tax=Helicobacter sp. 16-1353 TaxID=2004996 RepID=UPI000DCF2A99|nr:methylenetetrahydrofolate reductase [Helicobacter sp. 16-1353]RAX53121.1 hypothetical protein CCY99_05890 [Helicobacter sp. 16-1353]